MPPPGNKNQSKAAMSTKKKKNKKKRKQGKSPDNGGRVALSASPQESSSPSHSTTNVGFANVKNPLLEEHKAFMKRRCTSKERDNFFSNTQLDSDRRAELWMEQADTGEELVNRYSWAIPDERALRILKHFSPLVEIGCGANAYWCRVMAQCGIDIVGYDVHPEEGGQIISNSDNNNAGGKKQKKKKKRQRESEDSFQVQQGGPEVLATKELRKSGRTLFLCYSDEEVFKAPQPPTEDEDEDDENDEDSEDEEDEMTTLGVECLKHYTGDYVIHVGELFGDSLALEQSPWGRSSGPGFQQYLAATFHCILKASLPNWIHVRDTISVWKRSETCSIVFAADSDDEEEEDEEGDVEVEYKHIPVVERLPSVIAAPCLAHLLRTGSSIDEAARKMNVAGNQPKKGRDKKATTEKHAVKEPDSNDEDSGSEDDKKDTSSDNEPRNSSKKPPPKRARKDSSDDDDEEGKYSVEW